MCVCVCVCGAARARGASPLARASRLPHLLDDALVDAAQLVDEVAGRRRLAGVDVADDDWGREGRGGGVVRRALARAVSLLPPLLFARTDVEVGLLLAHWGGGGGEEGRVGGARGGRCLPPVSRRCGRREDRPWAPRAAHAGRARWRSRARAGARAAGGSAGGRIAARGARPPPRRTASPRAERRRHRPGERATNGGLSRPGGRDRRGRAGAARRGDGGGCRGAPPQPAPPPAAAPKGRRRSCPHRRPAAWAAAGAPAARRAGRPGGGGSPARASAPIAAGPTTAAGASRRDSLVRAGWGERRGGGGGVRGRSGRRPFSLPRRGAAPSHRHLQAHGRAQRARPRPSLPRSVRERVDG